MRRTKRFRAQNSGEAQPSRKARDLFPLFGLVLFLCGLFGGFYLGFPDAILQQRLTAELDKQLPGRVAFAEISLWPLFTLHATTPSIKLPPDAGDLSFDHARFSPLWESLLTGDPGFKGRLQKEDGHLDIRWQRSGALEVRGGDLAFDIPVSAVPSVRLSALLTAGQVTTTIPLQKDSVSRIEIVLDQLTVKGLESVMAKDEALRLGTLTLRATGNGTAFSVEELQSNDGDLIVSGDGTLLFVASRPERSRLNLTLSLRTTPQTDPTLAALLELAGAAQTDGSRKFRLTGTLGKPILR